MKKDDRAPRYDFVQIIQGERWIRAPALRLEKEDLANEPQGMRAAFLRRNEKLDLIGEEEQADLVVIPNGAEGEQTRDFRRKFALRLRRTAEISRCAHIHDQHHRQFALFGEFLDERGPHPRRHVPIDRANFVARLILAHFLEVHPASFEDAVVIAGETVSTSRAF